jgi:hypothetical protein
MSTNTGTNIPKETTPEISSNNQPISPVPHATMPEVTLNVDDVTTVFPDKTEPHGPVVKKEKSKKKGSKSAEKKKSSSTSVKKTPKLKMGESKVHLQNLLTLG